MRSQAQSVGWLDGLNRLGLAKNYSSLGIPSASASPSTAVEALHVRERRDQGFPQAGVVGLVAEQLLDQRERRHPIALLVKGIEQQFPGRKIVRPRHHDGA